MIKFFILFSFILMSSDVMASRDLNRKIMQQYSEALEEGQKQKTAGLLRSAAAKAKEGKVKAEMKDVLASISSQLDESDALISDMQKEISGVDGL